MPGSTTWYFSSGDINKDGTTGSAGFLADGIYKIGWQGQSYWYCFDKNGAMKTGWQQIDGKTYYFVENNTDPWYGRAMTGQQFIDGKEYNFDANGALLK